MVMAASPYRTAGAVVPASEIDDDTPAAGEGRDLLVELPPIDDDGLAADDKEPEDVALDSFDEAAVGSEVGDTEAGWPSFIDEDEGSTLGGDPIDAEDAEVDEAAAVEAMSQIDERGAVDANDRIDESDFSADEAAIESPPNEPFGAAAPTGSRRIGDDGGVEGTTEDPAIAVDEASIARTLDDDAQEDLAIHIERGWYASPLETAQMRDASGAGHAITSDLVERVGAIGVVASVANGRGVYAALKVLGGSLAIVSVEDNRIEAIADLRAKRCELRRVEGGIVALTDAGTIVLRRRISAS